MRHPDSVKPTYWKVARIVSKSWDDGVVVFNLDSGSTHLLNPTAAQALKCLEETPCDARVLSERLASQTALDSDAELVTHVERLLAQLDELGLVEPVYQ